MNNWIIFDPIQPLHMMLCDSIKNHIEQINKSNKVIIISEPSLKLLDTKDSDMTSNNTIFVVILNYHFWNTDQSMKQMIKNISHKFKYKVLYITEPTFYIAEKKIYQMFVKELNPFCLWSYTIENKNALSFIKHIPQMTIRPFVSPTYCWISNLNNKQKKIPTDIQQINNKQTEIQQINNKKTNKIIFVGIPNEYRLSVLKQFPKEELLIIEDIYTYEGWKTIVGENLFFLNIHRRESSKHLEMLRLVPLLANYCFVLSEHGLEEEEKLFSSDTIKFVDKDLLYKSFVEIKNEFNNEYSKKVFYEKLSDETDFFRENFDLSSEWNLFQKYFDNIIIK